MTVRDVFINGSYQLRAGWRIGSFVLVFAVGAVIFVSLMQLLFLAVPESKLIREGIGTFMFAMNAAVSAFVLLKWVDKRPWSSLGLTTSWRQVRQILDGLAIGVAMLSVAVLSMWGLGYAEIGWASVEWQYILTGLAGNLFLYVGVGFHEEILFRGYIFQSMTEGTGKLFATLFFSLVFGAAHMGNPNASAFGIANIVLAGILLSLAYLQTRTLWLPIGIHIGWNFTQGYLWGMPVSGTTPVNPLVAAQETGPDWLTGGTFGPEGGAVCTLVCAAACVVVWKFYRPSEEMQEMIRSAQSSQPFRTPSVEQLTDPVAES